MTLNSGNIAVLEFTAMCLMFRLIHNSHHTWAASVLGTIATMKLLPIAFFAALPTTRSRIQCLAAFAAVTIIGMAIAPSYLPEYIRCVAGLQGYASVTSELHISSMDNQAIYQYGPVASLCIIALISLASVFVWKRSSDAMERTAIIILAIFLVFPRIPPHAFLAYAAVPILVLYQSLSSKFKWIIVAILIASSWLLVCRAAGVNVPSTVQYWTTVACLAVIAINKRCYPHTTT